MSARVRKVVRSRWEWRRFESLYQAGCIPCDWWGFRFQDFQRALNHADRHDAASHNSGESIG